VDANKPSGSRSGPVADTDPAIANTEASDPDAPSTPDPSPDPPTGKGPRQVRSGDTLGRYDLLDELGEGGMATVFRARDTELRREVAVKVLFPHLARRNEVVRRFHREARAAAGLEHSNILRIYDVGGGEGDDPPFIVMELIRGRTLLQEIEQRGPLLAEVVACVGALLADALAAAHEAGIVHRDIKPSNVLIAQGGRLLLADFGVARLETEDSLVTRTGALLGTPAYMSPEQASGDTATSRSDLYSLGATLYQLSTGLLPYSGSPAKVMSLIATGSLVAPVRRRAEVGPDLSRVIEKLMDADPGGRPATAALVATELRALASAGGLGEPTDELAAYFEDVDGFLRSRTPRVVHAIISAGKQALADSRLPRAIALADRASALAPEDPAVKTLVETVTEGGRTRRRRTLVLAGIAGLTVAGGAAFTVSRLLDRGGPGVPDATQIALADARVDEPPRIDAAEIAEPIDAVDVEPPPIADAAVIDARARIHDAGVRHDAAPVAKVDAAALTVPPDAAAIAPPIDAEPPNGTLVITNDTWCDVAIDGVPRGRLNPGAKLTIDVPRGHHVVSCAQPGINPGWRRELDLAGGATQPIAGTLLSTVDVAIAIAGDRVKIDDRFYPRGGIAKLKPGRHRGVVFHGDQSGIGAFFDVPRVGCRLHEQGQSMVCDP